MIGYFTILYNHEIQDVENLVLIATELDLITRKGSWYYLLNEDTGELDQIGQGIDTVTEFFKENEDAYRQVYEQVMKSQDKLARFRIPENETTE